MGAAEMIPVVNQALAINEMLTTGSRSAQAAARNAERTAGAGRFVRTRKGLALFDENGRFIGVVKDPRASAPRFGRAAETMLLRRS